MTDTMLFLVPFMFFLFILFFWFKTDESKAYIPPTNTLVVQTEDKNDYLYKYMATAGTVPRSRLQSLSFTSFHIH